MEVVAIFGPTAVGKTGVAIGLAEVLRERGEEPVAISCDSIQIYRGLEVLSGAATEEERQRLEHRMLGVANLHEEYSVGRYAGDAHHHIDRLLARGQRPLVVGGTGLYLRAALSELELRPQVPAEIRAEVEADLAARGPEALHAELPDELASGVHPNDQRRVSRLTELRRLGIAPHGSSDGLWTARTRHPTRLLGLVADSEEMRTRIDRRVDAIVANGAASEVVRAAGAGASRTAQAAIGFKELLAGDVPAMKRAQWAYARRQLTWMRRMRGVELVDRTGLDDVAVAQRLCNMIDG